MESSRAIVEEKSNTKQSRQGQPSLNTVIKWFRESTKIKISFQKPHNKLQEIEGRIINLSFFGNVKDALLTFDSCQYGIYVREIVSCPYPNLPKRRLVLDNEANIKDLDTIVLRAGEYSVRLNKKILSERCPYFKKKLANLKKTQGEIDSIDLSEKFSAEMLRALIRFLDNRDVLLYSYALSSSYFSIYDQLNILASAHVVSDQEIQAEALKLICEHVWWKKHELLQQPTNLPPIIFNWLTLANDYLKNSTLALHTIGCFEDAFHFVKHNINKDKASKCLKRITGVPWNFDGLYFKLNPFQFDIHKSPDHPDSIISKIIAVLEARQVLEVRGNHASIGYHCFVRNYANLLKLSSQTLSLKEEFFLASEMISQITGRACQFLSLEQSDIDCTILEETGCIKLKKLSNERTEIIDYDLHKLISLKMQKLSLEQITKLHSQGTLRFEQSYKSEAKASIKMVATLDEKGNIDSYIPLTHSRLFPNTSNQNQTQTYHRNHRQIKPF